MVSQENIRETESWDQKPASADSFETKENTFISPELAIYAVVMEKVLSDPCMEEAFFGLSHKKRSHRK